MKKIKSIKIILKKKSFKKTMWGNTVAIHSVLKKKTKKLNYQPTQLNSKKIKSTKAILKKQNKKNIKKIIKKKT
jgi:hypothetical protein